MKLVPLGDRVVLKQLVAEETTKSGIVLPGQNKEKPQQAEVVAVGPGGMVDGKEVKMEVKVGDKVKKGQTLCIIEAMKLMNEIESEVDGEIVEICFNDEDMVEYGSILFKVK